VVVQELLGLLRTAVACWGRLWLVGRPGRQCQLALARQLEGEAVLAIAFFVSCYSVIKYSGR
jgi:hypothetical protein